MTPVDRQRLAELRQLAVTPPDDGAPSRVYTIGLAPELPLFGAQDVKFLLRLLDEFTAPPAASAMEEAKVILRDAGYTEASPGWIKNAEEHIAAALTAAERRGYDAAIAQAAKHADLAAEEEQAQRDDALSAHNPHGALTRARQCQTAREIAAAIRALKPGWLDANRP